MLLRKPAKRRSPLHHGDGWGPAALLPLRLLLLGELVRGALRHPRALPGRAAAAPGLRAGEWPPWLCGEMGVQAVRLASVLRSDSKKDMISGCLGFFTLNGDSGISLVRAS